MLPLSTGNTNGCNPISSNCIIWQGPDLACLNICTGDTISIIVAKIAELLCNLIQTGIESTFSIDGILQSCTVYGGNPEATNLTQLLQNIINVECNLQETVWGNEGLVETVTELTTLIETLELSTGAPGNDGPEGDPGPAGTSVVDTVDLGDGTFYFVYSDGTTSDPIEVPTNTTIEQITNEITNTINTNTIQELNPEVLIPKCLLSVLTTNSGVSGYSLYNNINSPAQVFAENDPMLLYSDNNSAYYEIDSNGDYIYYNGWLAFVTAKLCCLLPYCEGSSLPPFNEHGESDTLPNNLSVSRLPVITQLKNRVLTMERKHGTSYIPPKVTVKCVIPKKIGQRVEMQELLMALERDYCQYRKALGNTNDVLTASRYECTNLSGGNRLAGNGVMSTVKGWNTKPSNLAQSFSNAWRTICDLRTAVEDLQTSVTPTACTGFIYDPKTSLIKSSTGDVTGISVGFQECTIPSGYYDCDKGRGTKITIEDSSLNSIVSYANVSQMQSSENNHNITIANTQLDTTSNFKIKIHFCFTDGANQCERLMEVTLENSSACPTVTITTTGEASVEYNVTGLNTTSNSTYDILVETSAGVTVAKQAIKSPSSTSVTGKATGLLSGTKYNYYVQVTSPAGNVSTCPKSTFITSAPTCASHSKTSTEYVSTIASLGSTKVVMASYKNGSTVTTWIAGFDLSTGAPTVYKGTDSGITPNPTTDLTFVKHTKSITDNPTTSITCGNVAYTATGMTTSMNSNENGWQYVDALKSNGNTTYYIYALVNTTTHTIDQVVYCCDCKPSYVRARYGKVNNDDGSYNPNSRGYRPDKHAFYVVAGKDLRIPIDIVGFTQQTTPISWIASSCDGGTTKFNYPTDAAYDSALGGDVQLIYTPNLSRPTAGFDSIDIYAQTDCTVGNEGNRTMNTVTIAIQDAAVVINKNTDITVFVDTNVFSIDEVSHIKSNFTAFKNDFKTLCPNWSGTINYVPVGGSNSGDYLQYTKAMVDMKGGASGSITVATGYDTFKSLPAYWSASSTEGIPSTVYIFSFIGDCNSNGSYGSSNLANGWNSPAQPTASYQKNYDELLDIINAHGGAPRSVWGLANGCTFKQFDLKQILVPVVSGSQDKSAANVLQAFGALTGTVLNNDGFKGLGAGSVQNPVNLTDYLGANASLPVPYTGTTSYGSNTINGLYTYGFRVGSFIDKSYLTSDLNKQSAGEYGSWLEDLIASITGADTGGVRLIADSTCPTGVDLMQPMKGDVNGVDVVIYGENTTCRTASTTSETASSCIAVYNSTGVMFDTSVPAYTSIAGGNVGAGALSNSKWYAQNGASSTDKIRKVAQYNSSGTGGYWLNIRYVSDASCT